MLKGGTQSIYLADRFTSTELLDPVMFHNQKTTRSVRHLFFYDEVLGWQLRADWESYYPGAINWERVRNAMISVLFQDLEKELQDI